LNLIFQCAEISCKYRDKLNKEARNPFKLRGMVQTIFFTFAPHKTGSLVLIYDQPKEYPGKSDADAVYANLT